MPLKGKVLRLDPQRHIATIKLPAVGRGRSFRVDYALPGEGLASVRQWTHGLGASTVGTVVAVRPVERGAEVDLAITADSAWQRLGGRSVRVEARCSFAGVSGIDPFGGRVHQVEID
jgi:hypothetical protein